MPGEAVKKTVLSESSNNAGKSTLQASMTTTDNKSSVCFLSVVLHTMISMCVCLYVVKDSKGNTESPRGLYWQRSLLV